MTKICLNMIVKDEAHVVERALRSVCDFIADYVILDTGSSDDTPAVIESFMRNKNIPGKVYSGDWVNFSQARNRALELARQNSDSDYVLLIDADDELACTEPEAYSSLDPAIECYTIQKAYGSIVYFAPFLLNIRRRKWKWRGPVHEYIGPEDSNPHRASILQGSRILCLGGGARSLGKTQREKYLADAELLEQELITDPDNARSRFYLAQSYRDAGEHELAIEHYRKRVEMGGWEEETFVAQLESARQMMRNGYPYERFLPEFLKAYEMRPSRIEPLYELTAYCRKQDLFHQGYLFGKTALGMELPPDTLFVSKYMYDYGLMDEFSLCAYWAGRYQESYDCCLSLLSSKLTPSEHKPRIGQNLGFAAAQLGH
ncbi:MAG: glycosyltransferase [Vulcanimicrobiota bacterium]